MKIISDKDTYFNEIVEMAYHKYCGEIKMHPCLTQRSQLSFADFFRRKLHGMDAVIGLEGNKCIGFLLYSIREEDKMYCDIPVWGYGTDGSDSTQIISLLFQYLAGQIVERETCFSVRIYAHDDIIQRLFSFMQFGIQSEKGVRRIEEIEYNSEYEVKEIKKNELQQNWTDIWSLLTQLINHLKKSPVFYPGNEFTEEAYKGFFADSETKVYIALDKNRIIGLIEANSENLEYVFSDEHVMNVGEAYVEPDYRGKKVAQALLHYLDLDLRTDNVEYEWVEHGTANPTAMGFWNKYFETVEYEFIRTCRNV